MNAGKRRAVPRFALIAEEAAESLGIGESTFNEFVRPFVRAIRTGKTGTLVRYPTVDIERWADENAERTL